MVTSLAETARPVPIETRDEVTRITEILNYLNSSQGRRMIVELATREINPNLTIERMTQLMAGVIECMPLNTKIFGVDLPDIVIMYDLKGVSLVRILRQGLSPFWYSYDTNLASAREKVKQNVRLSNQSLEGFQPRVALRLPNDKPVFVVASELTARRFCQLYSADAINALHDAIAKTIATLNS